MNPQIKIALDAARDAGKIILQNYDHIEKLTINQKGKNDFVSEVDLQAEQAIVRALHKAYPSDAIIGEEEGFHYGNENSVRRWVIDPLDGTTNFLHQFPLFCTSIALIQEGKIESGLIYCPLLSEYFAASRGDGARCNQHRIRVSKKTSFSESLALTNFVGHVPGWPQEQCRNLPKLFPEIAGIRSTGSAALNLAYLAANRVDVLWMAGLKPWDMAAGILIAQEAGALVTDFKGENAMLQTGEVVAANIHLHPKLIAHVQSSRSL
jgi:myo-inositol-1(or 4)-monophosphatase